jgi:acyl-coenzyme A synthetase/AMP-(fatty) acid ligase
MKAGLGDESLLFFDPAGSGPVTYGDLRRRVAAPNFILPARLRAAGAAEAILGLLSALLLNAELTLLDFDTLSTDSRSPLAPGPELIGGREALAGRAYGSVMEMIEAAYRSDRFRLTLFTSGSTGLPKRVTHSLPSLIRMLRVGDRHADDVWGLAYSPTHIAGVQVVLQAFFNGNPLIQLFGRDRLAVIAWIQAFGVTHVSATPSFYRLLFPVDHALAGVRAVTLGGERSDMELIGRLRSLFPAARIRNLYASTEAGSLLATDGDAFEIPDALKNLIRISDGQLEVHASLLGEFDSEGGGGAWYRTGDVVEEVSSDPIRFRILSRDRDWVNVGGLKVNPGEVEIALLACPGVREARVYGRRNSVVGYILCAEVVADHGFSETAARAWLADRLQPAKIPRMIKTVAEIARTRTGKVLRA